MEDLTHNGRPVFLSRSVRAVDVGSPRVLVDSPWEYVKLWLKRQEDVPSKALHFWQQAAEFQKAATVVNDLAKPLPAYYCMLNCTKAYLECRRASYSPYHGLSGKSLGRAYLANETVIPKDGGVFPSFCKRVCSEDDLDLNRHSIKDLLRFLAFVHRAYFLTYESEKEVFVPIGSPKYIVDKKNRKVYISFDVRNLRYLDGRTINSLPSEFKMEETIDEKALFVSKSSCDWLPGKGSAESNKRGLRTLHSKVRKYFDVIISDRPLWYVRRASYKPPWPQVMIMYAVMHRLSDLARYSPDRMITLGNSKYNWLVQEFLTGALGQFVDLISSEITGQEFFAPGRRT